MTHDEAKAIRKGHYVSVVGEPHKVFRVTEVWANEDESIIRARLASFNSAWQHDRNHWIPLDRFVRVPNPNKASTHAHV